VPANERRDVTRFSDHAHTYESGRLASWHRRVIDAVVEIVVDTAPTPADVLDVGCGTGLVLRRLAERYPDAASLVGVDPAPGMLEVARAHSPDPRVRFEAGTADALPLPAGTFDLVVTTLSLHHWRDQRGGLAECARVLRPGGVLVLADMVARGPARLAAALRRRRDRIHTAAELEALLRAAGLRVDAWRPAHRLGPVRLVDAVVARRGPVDSMEP
jgi:ubiquinone/menaquinone biosynthesis C-methylase UbiE